MKETRFLTQAGATFEIPEEEFQEEPEETVLYDWDGGVTDEDE